MTLYPARILFALWIVASLTACGRSRGETPPTPATGAEPAPPRNVLTAEDIERSSGTSLEMLIVTRIAGVTLVRGDDGRAILQIRGSSTIHGVREPLVVLDGILLEPNPGGNLSAINPLDIALLEVLRDPASIARYGARGSNGVIVITTKRAR